MNKTIKYTAGFLLSIASLSILVSCSTKKNTFTSRTYHNLTAHYNVYWNGMDNLRSGKKEFENSLKDNYTTVLPVYYYGEKGSGGKMGQYSEIAMKKSIKTIQKHSMVFNRKEYNRWIDDSYFLMGKAYFYKQDYPMARRTFEFVIKTYNNSDLKWEALLWQIQSNLQLKDFGKAEPMLDMMQGKIREGKAPYKYQRDLDLVYANFFILQKNYQPAVDYLNQALDFHLPRKMKTRVLFILGQIYQKNGELDKASQCFKLVVKRTPSFDMEFNAKINLALCYEGKGANREFIIAKLNKMLKDDKNKDNQDQIFYALAQIALKDNDTTGTIDNLRKSVATSRTNNYQKSVSALQLADIYFEHKDYTNAQAYYDSTMQFLPKDFPNYKEIKDKTSTLTDLVTNIQIVQREDSLLKLAAMSENDRLKVIDGIIAKVMAEEIKKKQEEMEKQQNMMLFGQTGKPTSDGGQSTPGSWYFYNSSALASGFGTFTKKWGRRKLEDYWCLSNKIQTTQETEDLKDTVMTVPGDTTGKKTVARSRNPKDRKYYLQDIPTQPEDIKAANDKIIEAYYSLGFIYIEGLQDYPNSIESFETLIQRYPDNKYNVATYYKLQQLYHDLGNQPKSDQYRDLILTKYPETDFAKLLINPNYYKEIQSKQEAISVLYEETYTAFTAQQYYMVINNTDLAKAKYPNDSILLPRFEYLKGLSLGKIEVIDSLVYAMQKIIIKYPKSDVRPLAENVLSLLGKQQTTSGQTGKTDSTASIPDFGSQIYAFDANAIHFYIIIVNNEKTNVDALKIKLSDFNTNYHGQDDLQVNSLLMDNKMEMVTVGNFTNSDKAMRYFNSINESKYIFNKLQNTGDFFVFIISADNYPIFYRSKNVQQYIKFFESNYPIE